MTDWHESFRPFAEKMAEADQPHIAIKTFAHYFERLRAGETGTLAGAELTDVGEIPDAERLVDAALAAGQRAVQQAVVLKLNGGLGTSMGMTAAKSLLPVREGLTFLDVIVRQVLQLRREFGVELPLVWMNSFRTREDCAAVLGRYSELAGPIPSDFLQHKVPRILIEDLQPVSWPEDRHAEWCPPGHGDLYPALCTSGMLEALLGRGLRYAFVSNSDNLGATLDLALLGHFVDSGAPFLMEVADRTESDKKGGHLARMQDGRLTLRESAQCPPDEIDEFQDISRHRYFNTNNLWIDLEQLRDELDRRGGVLPLPMICNKKRVVPTDAASPAVYQLETAMGAALSVFENGHAIRVPRSRFLPVKTTADLLVVRSDVFELGDDQRLLAHDSARQRALSVRLGGEFTDIGEFERRFPHGAPSLRDARSLTVEGDVVFGREVRVVGEAVVRAPRGQTLHVEDRATLGGE